MRLWDQELLSSKKFSPVTDGLVLWIDGEDGVLSRKLKNRVTGDFDVGISPTYYWTVTQDGNFIKLEIDRNNVDTDLIIGRQYASQLTVGTVEATLGENNSAIGLFTFTYYWPRFYQAYKDKYVRYAWAIDNYKDIKIEENPIHIAALPGVIFINGTKYKTDTRFNNVSFPEQIAIFRHFRSSTETGKQFANIGSLRAYSRQLSDEEILQNLKYEKSIGRA